MTQRRDGNAQASKLDPRALPFRRAGSGGILGGGDCEPGGAERIVLVGIGDNRVGSEIVHERPTRVLPGCLPPMR